VGLMDKIKGLLKGREHEAKTGIDKAADAAQKVVPDQHDAKVEQVAEKAKDVVDDLAKPEGASPEDSTPEGGTSTTT
jgi:hypothetical protein